MIKICKKCKNEYPLMVEFWHRDSSRKNGFSPYCKFCQRESSRQRNSANRKNRLEYDRKYRKAHPEKSRFYISRWVKENPEKKLESVHRRRAREFNADGSHTAAEVRALYVKQNGLCFHCNADLSTTDYHEDHWIPLSRGGSDYIDNIRLLCPTCNLKKSDKLPCEWCVERYSC